MILYKITCSKIRNQNYLKLNIAYLLHVNLSFASAVSPFTSPSLVVVKNSLSFNVVFRRSDPFDGAESSAASKGDGAGAGGGSGASVTEGVVCFVGCSGDVLIGSVVVSIDSGVVRIGSGVVSLTVVG